MLSPNEITEHSFSKKISGYNVSEVDEYIAYLLEKYTELYTEYTQVCQKLDASNAKIGEFDKAQITAAGIVSKAENDAKLILDKANENAESVSRSVSESCDILVEEYRKKVVLQTEVLCDLTEQCKAFKNKLLQGYRAQVDYLNGMDFGIDEQKSDEELINEVLTLAKEHIKLKKSRKNEATDVAPQDDFSPVAVSEERSFSDNEEI